MRSAYLFAILMAVQLALGVACVALCVSAELNAPWYLVAALAIGLTLVGDVGLMYAYEYYEARARIKARNNVLQAELDAYMTAYESQMKQITAIAYARHDVRNELAVVASLVRQGCLEEAEGMLCDLEKQIEKVDLP